MPSAFGKLRRRRGRAACRPPSRRRTPRPRRSDGSRGGAGRDARRGRSRSRSRSPRRSPRSARLPLALRAHSRPRATPARPCSRDAPSPWCSRRRARCRAPRCRRGTRRRAGRRAARVPAPARVPAGRTAASIASARRRDIAARAGDHHADGVEQMPPRIVAHLVGERVVAQLADEADDRVGRAGGRMAGVEYFGVGHGRSPMAQSLSLPGELHQRIDRDHALARRAHDQRIDLGLRDRRVVTAKLRQRDDRVRQRVEIAFGLAADSRRAASGRAPRRSSPARSRGRPARGAGCGRDRFR